MICNITLQLSHTWGQVISMRWVFFINQTEARRGVIIVVGPMPPEACRRHARGMPNASLKHTLGTLSFPRQNHPPFAPDAAHVSRTSSTPHSPRTTHSPRQLAPCCISVPKSCWAQAQGISKARVEPLCLPPQRSLPVRPGRRIEMTCPHMMMTALMMHVYTCMHVCIHI